MENTIVKKSKEEKKELSNEKKAHKKRSKNGRDEIILAFLNAEIPNWNIKLIVL